jgi:hypothetical protein
MSNNEYLKKREEGLQFLNEFDKNNFALINDKKLNKAIPLFQESINRAPNKEEAYESSILLQDTLEKLLSIVEKDKIEKHDDIYRKYIYYSSKLMTILANNMKYSQQLKDSKEDFYKNIAVNIIKEIPLKNIGNTAYEMIGHFSPFKEAYYELISSLMRHYFNYALNLFENKKIIPSKNFFLSVFDIQSNYNIDVKALDKLKISKEIKTEIEDVIESSNFYINRIDAMIELQKGDELYEQGVNAEESMDMDDIREALTCYRNALNEINKIKENKDIELEAICYSHIAKIMYRIFKNKKQNNKIKSYVLTAVNLGISLAPKNVGKEKWYIDATNILQEIRNEEAREEERNDDQYREELKKRKEEIFKELYAKKEESNLVFVKFILEKYPYKGYKNDGKNIEEEFSKDNKNFIKTLVAKYHPDRYPKNTEEEKKHYVIIHEISVILNGMYSIYDSVNRKDA